MNFFYIDPTDYTDLYEACYAEVVAEAKDTGDFPMYGEEMLRQSAQWKMEDMLREVAQYVFFKHVQLHKYDITDKGITQACYDEMKADGYDIVITEKEMQVLASHRCEEFKDYMRPLFHGADN